MSRQGRCDECGEIAKVKPWPHEPLGPDEHLCALCFAARADGIMEAFVDLVKFVRPSTRRKGDA